MTETASIELPKRTRYLESTQTRTHNQAPQAEAGEATGQELACYPQGYSLKTWARKLKTMGLKGSVSKVCDSKPNSQIPNST